MHNGLIGSLLRSRLVSISGGGKLFVSLIALHHISFLLIWCQNFFQWSPTCITLVLFCILLQKCSITWIGFCAKLRLGTSGRSISSLFYLFILIYYLRWCSSFVLLSEDIKNYPGPTSSSGQCFSICHWNLNSITAHNFVLPTT